jgi:fermentation-respiration switch protein FrsA (DUF1100 family)
MWFKQLLWALSPLPLWASPFWRRSWMHRIGHFAFLGAAYSCAVAVALLMYVENRLLYQAVPATSTWFAPPPGLPVTDVELKTADGTNLHGWWATPPGWQPADGALLYLHGNGGNLSYRGGFLASVVYQLRSAVLVVDYPGYGRSGGSPSERGCYATADAAYDWLTRNRGVPADRLILYGGSLGGGVATDLAVRKPHRALVLVSTFTSFPEEAQTKVRWLPCRWLARNQFNNLAKIASVHGPVFIAHGTRDDLIPFSMSQRLYDAANAPKRFFAMEGWGHEDILTPDGLVALRKFLDENPTAPRE